VTINGATQTFKYPRARKGGTSDDYFGTRVGDPYRWMEDLNSPELKRWIDAENAITFKYLDGLQARERLKRPVRTRALAR